MPNEIQSISQGTFTIGQTSATNFVGGPGITVDSPSEGTVRISNDETVLFSSNSGGVTAGTFNENLTNFEYVDFYYNRVGTTSNINLAGHTRIDLSYGVPSALMCQAGLTTGPSAMFHCVEFFDLTNSTFTWQAGYNESVVKTGVSGDRIDAINFKNFGFTKVVGVNRLSGGNA